LPRPSRPNRGKDWKKKFVGPPKPKKSITTSATKSKIPLNKYQVKTTGVTKSQAANIRFRPISQKLHIGDIGYRTITKATKIADTAKILDIQGFTKLNPSTGEIHKKSKWVGNKRVKIPLDPLPKKKGKPIIKKKVLNPRDIKRYSQPMKERVGSRLSTYVSGTKPVGNNPNSGFFDFPETSDEKIKRLKKEKSLRLYRKKHDKRIFKLKPTVASMYQHTISSNKNYIKDINNAIREEKLFNPEKVISEKVIKPSPPGTKLYKGEHGLKQGLATTHPWTLKKKPKTPNKIPYNTRTGKLALKFVAKRALGPVGLVWDAVEYGPLVGRVLAKNLKRLHKISKERAIRRGNVGRGPKIPGTTHKVFEPQRPFPREKSIYKSFSGRNDPFLRNTSKKKPIKSSKVKETVNTVKLKQSRKTKVNNPMLSTPIGKDGITQYIRKRSRMTQ